MFLCFWSNLKLLCNWTYLLVTICFIFDTLILMNSFESIWIMFRLVLACLDLFNHSKCRCNFEFSIWFSFRKTSKSFVKTCWSISRDDAILKFPFWFFKVTFKRWCNTFWIIFSLVWWCNFEIFHLALLQKMVQYKPFKHV